MHPSTWIGIDIAKLDFVAAQRSQERALKCSELAKGIEASSGDLQICPLRHPDLTDALFAAHQIDPAARSPPDRPSLGIGNDHGIRPGLSRARHRSLSPSAR